MKAKEIKKTLGLTEQQKSLVENFLEAARQMNDAGVYAFFDQETGDGYFINGLNAKNFWIGEGEFCAPFENDFESVEQRDIDESCGCISVFLSDIFNNYAFPDDVLCFEKLDK